MSSLYSHTELRRALCSQNHDEVENSSKEVIRANWSSPSNPSLQGVDASIYAGHALRGG